MSTELKQVNKLKKSPRRNENINDIKFIERLIKISRVTKVTKGGKKLSFRAVVVIGDENGQVGVGVGKAEDVVNAFKKAKTDGRKNLINIPLTKSLSIPHGVIGDVGACKIIMRPSIEGSGVIAGGAMRSVLELAGVQNVLAKCYGGDITRKMKLLEKQKKGKKKMLGRGKVHIEHGVFMKMMKQE